MNSKIILLFIVMSFSMQTFALDRAQLTQSKIQSALSSVLPRNDFLVIVNRLDTLDDGGESQVIDGTLKMLPGLNLGVDSKGELVRQDAVGGSYMGPISVKVIIESDIKLDTYKAIENLLPEIIGGVRDDDEVKISQQPLRQPNKSNNAPQVSINNSGDNKNQMQENIKFLALLLLTGGLFFWFLSRLKMNGDDKSSSNGGPKPYAPEEAKSAEEVLADSMQKVSPSDFEKINSETVALFLLKEIKEKNEVVWFKWIKFAPPNHQREVFDHLPSWILTYLRDLASTKKVEEEELAKLTLHDLVNEMALIEKSFKTSFQKKKAFLQWFPAEALRNVPRRSQLAFSDAGKSALWSIRPDLGNFVKPENLDFNQVMKEPSESEIEVCLKELFNFPSIFFETNDTQSTNVVSRWTNLINQIEEFRPIDAQLLQAKEKLSPVDFEKLIQSVAHLKTPVSFTPAQVKDWLRAVNPDDYYWWLHLINIQPNWQLASELRPMRLVMFNQAAESLVYKNWTEDQKKQASVRLLIGFRALISGTSEQAIQREAS